MKKKGYICYGISAVFLLAFMLSGNVFHLQPIQNWLAYNQIGETESARPYVSFAPLSVAQVQERQAETEQPSIMQDLAFDTKESVADFAKVCVEKLFHANTENLESWINYNDGSSSSIQPVGWFVRFSDNVSEYAVWVSLEPKEIRVSRSISQGLGEGESGTKTDTPFNDDDYLKKAGDILRNTLGEMRRVSNIEIVDTGVKGSNTIIVKILLEEGASYSFSFYVSTGELKELTYTL